MIRSKRERTTRIQVFRRTVLSWLFDALYRAGYWAYDPLTVAFFGPEWHRWRQTVLPHIEVGPALEIGCGTGKMLPEIETRSGFAIGLDLSDSMLRAARRNARGMEVIRATGERLPFIDSTFQSIVSTFPARYIAQRSTLDEIARVLKPGGRLLVVMSARFDRFQIRRPWIHPILRIAYGSSRSMSRLPDGLLAHDCFDGAWHELRTAGGRAFVWIATRNSEDQGPRS